MQNPETEIREYLEKLIHKYFFINSLNKQLKLIREWQSHSHSEFGLEAFSIGSSFFRLVFSSFNHTILIELNKLTSESKNDKITLPDWLEKAKRYSYSIKPTRYNPNADDECELLKKEEYSKLIETQIDELKSKQNIIDNIKANRHKALAHSGIKNSEDLADLFVENPISTNEIEELMSVISSILKEHYLLLFKADLNIEEIITSDNVDSVLQYVSAFSRARKDKDLLKLGFQPRKYMEVFGKYHKDKKSKTIFAIVKEKISKFIKKN